MAAQRRFVRPIIFASILYLVIENTLSEMKHQHYSGVRGAILPSSALKTVHSSGALGCATQCSRTRGCLSYNFYTNATTGQKNCHLNSRRAFSNDVLTLEEGASYFSNNEQKEEKDCNDLGGMGMATINVLGFGLKDVYCDDGWLVVLRRHDDTVDFQRNWTEYKNGFGDPSGQFWLGNDALHALTNQGDYSMFVGMVSCDNNYYYVRWNLFRIKNESQMYEVQDISVESYSTATALHLEESLGWTFTTHDEPSSDCSNTHGGGWWYNSCARWSLTGFYSNCEVSGNSGRQKSMKFTDITGNNCDQGGGWWFGNCARWSLTSFYSNCVEVGTMANSKKMKFADITGNNCDYGCLLKAATMKIRRNT